MDPLVLTVDMAGLAAGLGRARGSDHLSREADGRVVGRPRGPRVPRRLAEERRALAHRHAIDPRDQGQRERAPTGTRPGLTNQMLFVRDRQVCAYCGGRFMIRDLSRDHVVPVSRGGTDSWTNAVTACRSCNTRKGGRSPEQAGMPLLYVPYVPNRHEHFILRNRRILADQMEYLLAGVPRTSRLHGASGR